MLQPSCPRFNLQLTRHSRMRRAVANALILVLAAPALLVLAAVNAESQLPPCCRRDGSHHCTSTSRMAQTNSGDQTPKLQGPADRCRYRAALPFGSAKIYPATR